MKWQLDLYQAPEKGDGLRRLAGRGIIEDIDLIWREKSFSIKSFI